MARAVFVSANGSRKTDYSSGVFEIWARGRGARRRTRGELLEIVGPQRLRQEIFTIDWHFWTASSGIASKAVDEYRRR